VKTKSNAGELEADDEIEDGVASQKENELLSANSESETYRAANRHLLDVYGDSLRHVNSLLNQVFGVAGGRKAPAHMPHFIDTNILLAMHEQWYAKFWF
jgi:UDP-N-acetylglucosamine-lysosomal-enzyme